MHPALSVILFTTAAGIGYGLLALIGMLAVAGGGALLPQGSGFGLTAFALALGLVTVGLLSSTLHLGHPERAWRAFSQWRSSWLSREGVVAAVTYVPAGLLALAWLLLGPNSPAIPVLGLLTAVMALLTVACTAMIYASLRTIHQWHNAWVLPNYLALSLYTGALWLAALLGLWGASSAALSIAVLAFGVAALATKLLYWRFIDTTASPSTPESATGLRGLGRVRLFEAPHTEDNYLMKEMGFRIARKHARRLRLIAGATAFAIPLLLTLIALAERSWLGATAALVAALAGSAGVFVERWLFFAEARHTVTLYYGAAAA